MGIFNEMENVSEMLIKELEMPVDESGLSKQTNPVPLQSYPQLKSLTNKRGLAIITSTYDLL